nr:iron sulfur cluster assembly 2 [Hymenolepis microstoma]
MNGRSICKVGLAHVAYFLFTSEVLCKLKEIGEDNGLLRVIVDSGGCSGFQYKYEVDTTLNNDDLIIENSGVRVVVDPQSMQFIEGSKLDYEEELIRSGFRIQNNPQSEKGCSCGSSFALKLD